MSIKSAAVDLGTTAAKGKSSSGGVSWVLGLLDMATQVCVAVHVVRFETFLFLCFLLSFFRTFFSF